MAKGGIEITCRAAGALVAAFGFSALAGWVLDLPQLASLGSGLIPMAPSTASLFVLHGLVLWLRAESPQTRLAAWTAHAAAGLAALVALLLFVLGGLGIHLEAEHLGLQIEGTLRGARLGHMSPVTAAGFVLASLSSLMSARATRSTSLWQGTIAAGAAGLVMCGALDVLLAYLYGEPLLYGGPIIPPAANTTLAFVLLSGALLMLSRRRLRAPNLRPSRVAAVGWFVLGFALVATAVITAGYASYKGYERHYRAGVEHQLAAVAELKIDGLAQWRKERFADADLLFDNERFAGGVRGYLNAPDDPGARARLDTWLAKIQAAHQYNRVLLVDPQGALLRSAPEATERLAPHLVDTVTETLQARRVAILDFHRDAPGGPIYLGVAVPIFEAGAARKPLGLLVLRIDASTYLYPFIKRWPTASRTAETLLVRRDGDEVVFLNELRFQAGTALNLKSPLTDLKTTAVQAALGREGIVEGVDYRGVPVVAFIRKVPDSPWVLVARIDAEEIYAPLAQRLWELVLVITALILAAGASLAFIWHRQAVRYHLERHEAAAELTRLRQAVDASGDAIFMTDRDGVITFVSAGFTHLYGFEAAEVVHKVTPRILKSGQLPPEAYSSFWAAITAKQQVKGELVNRTKDGRLLTVESSANAIIDARGNVVGFMAVQRDVTERRGAEAHRERLEEQLRVSQKMEAIGGLAGGIAHDFNNLLSVILSYVGFALQSVAASDPLHDDLLEIKKAGERAATLTRQLLAFSRKQILQPVPLDMNQAATGLEKMLRRILGEDIDLVQALAPDLGLTMADPGQLDQVLMNLVVNARDAMPHGGKLTIETANVELGDDTALRHAVKPGPYVMLAVTDTGCGMDDKVRGRLFEPFFTTKAKGKGTGLGLATVYGIVKQSGGNIWVYSEVGKGSTFKIYLPRIPATLAVARGTPLPPPTTHTGGGETVLVIEDEEAVRNVVVRTLREAGYTVLAAANGLDGLHRSVQHLGKIHLAVTDIVMPQMSGKEFADRLARIRPETKVLFMSGYTGNAIVHHGVLDPGTQFIGKPFSAADLVRKVRETLDSVHEPGPPPPTDGSVT
ncbi:MAG: PAS domain S-box protein [Deltaproteobacteria bacterium]|nr:PAS domain S-box protein [Deltaproteobacteria bacterium]